MVYLVFALKEDGVETFGEKNFSRYQDARRYAKELVSSKAYFEIWIEGYEMVLDKDLKF